MSSRNRWIRKNRTESKYLFRPALEVLEARVLLTAGKFDSTFGNKGMISTQFGGIDLGLAMAIQPGDDKIVAVGATSAGGGGENFAISRYNPNGDLDTSFSLDGKVITDFFGDLDEADAVAVQSDGKIVAAGVADDPSAYSRFALARYLPDGTLDPAFGFGGNGEVTTSVGAANSSITAMKILADGSIMAAGNAERVPAGSFGAVVPQMALAHYLPDGFLDPSFGDHGIAMTDLDTPAYANGLGIQNNGAIVVAGRVGGQLAVVRFTSSGAPDTTFGNNGVSHTSINVDEEDGIALRNDGGIVVGGNSFVPYVKTYIVSLLPNGGLDKNFDADGILNVPSLQLRDLAIQADGKILAMSPFFSTIRYNPDGSQDPTFSGIQAIIPDMLTYKMVLQADGKIVEVGIRGVSVLGPQTDFVVARFDGAFSTINISKIAKLLVIQGGKSADQLSIATDARGVTVSSLRERTAPFTIPGVDNVWVETGTGDDSVRVDVMGSSARGLNIRADLGGGDDSFSISFGAVPPGPCRVEVNGGDGDDRIMASFLASDPPLSAAPQSSVDLDLNGDAGDDHIDLMFGFDPQSEMTASPDVYLNTPTRASLNGGSGDNDIRVIYGFNPQPDPPARLFIEAPQTIQAEGGSGGDDIRVIYGFNPQPDPPAYPGVMIDAPVSLNLDGGRGDDHVGCVSGFDPHRASHAMPAIIVNSILQIAEVGGTGNDHLLGEFKPRVQAGGLLDASFAGGEGDDVITTRLDETDPRSTGTAIIAVDAGAGDDVASFSLGAIYGFADGHCDLGPGNDSFQGRIGNNTTAFGDGTVMPQVSIDVKGGLGNDLIGLLFGNADGSPAQFMTRFDVNLAGGSGDDNISLAANNCAFFMGVTTNISGGNGNDQITVVGVGNTNDAAFAMILDGGAGNDLVSANLRFDPLSQGVVQADVLGGAGNDMLTFNLYGVADTQIIEALIDGGAGIDTAIHTDNVLTIHVER
jgi:uncharacterized delta-60 repeat protein